MCSLPPTASIFESPATEFWQEPQRATAGVDSNRAEGQLWGNFAHTPRGQPPGRGRATGTGRRSGGGWRRGGRSARVRQEPEACGEVGGLADHRLPLRRALADQIADDDKPGGNADADGEPLRSTGL